MNPSLQADNRDYTGTGKLAGKVAIITGGDSGIGRAVSIFFAREGSDIAIVYYDEHEDARETQRLVEKEGRRAILIFGDVADSSFCKLAVEQTINSFGTVDILVNNAAVQFPQQSLLDISDEQLEKTFKTNIFGYFYMAREFLPHCREGSVIINTTSVTAYRGSNHLIDYSSTKGAIVSFTRLLSLSLAEKKIRVNAVAPGPVWTPHIPLLLQ